MLPPMGPPPSMPQVHATPSAVDGAAASETGRCAAGPRPPRPLWGQVGLDSYRRAPDPWYCARRCALIRQTPLLFRSDPFGGSGTLAIEAAVHVIGPPPWDPYPLCHVAVARLPSRLQCTRRAYAPSPPTPTGASPARRDATCGSHAHTASRAAVTAHCHSLPLIATHYHIWRGARLHVTAARARALDERGPSSMGP